ncbi:unnamed protein product [Nesidiocoris tenuis]|uniref:RING-type E3 ubiquitin transferase n=1 Tax=Nesidiocoris tenuis TaxID=355587 RepID=A0A6H5HCC0_9HEMI|nr:unnamed protein product [Nesidiocoris tenuis]
MCPQVKPECPLCKQRFTIIFHSIKSMIDFQEYRLDQALLEPRLDPPRIFLALQQGSRPAFGYRTTMGFHGFTTAVPRVSSRSRMMAAHGLLPPGARVSSGGFPPSSVPNSTGRVNSSSNRSTLEFRRNVYRHNLWVRPPADQDRVRESSPEFYRPVDILIPLQEFGRPFLMGNQGSYPALHGSAATMELNDHIRSVAHGLFADLRHTARQIAMTRNRRSGTPLSSFVDSLSTNLRRSSISPPLPLLRPERPAPEVITLSSDDGDLVDDASDDSDVQIIGSLPPHHLRPPLRKTRPKKRLRNYKSSKYVDDGSDSGSEEDKAEIRDGKDEGSGESAEDSTWRTSNRKSGRSRKNSSSSSKTSRKKDAQSSVSRRETSSKTRKAVNSRKDPVDGVSSDDDVCSQCGNAKNRQSVTESKARRKRRNTCGCRQAKKKRRRSTLSSGDLTSESARAASSSVVEKPKALSKKDIILNKRRSELSAIMNSADDQEASHKRRPAFDVDVQVDDSRSSLKSETDDDKSNDTILSMGQECTTLAAVSNASSALSGASFSSSPHRTPYEIPGDMSPPNLRRFDDTTPASGAFAPYYPRSSSSASTSTSSSSLSPSVRGGPPRLKSIVVRPTPTYWSPTSPTQRPSTCTDDSNDNFDF